MRLLDIHEFIQAYDKTNGCSPSYAEIVNAGLASSTSVVSFYFRHMNNLGMITYHPRIARSVRALPLPETPSIQKALALKAKMKANP